MKRIIVALVVLFFISISILYAQTDSLKFQKLNVDNNDDFSGFSMLNKDLTNNKMFFTGENHTFRTSNVKLELKMLRYLNKNAGVRNLLFEFGFAGCWLIDQYVQTGDSTLLNILKTYSFDIYANYYKELRAFNATLDSAHRIHIYGIDCERFVAIPIKVLSLQIPTQNPPKEIELSIESIRSIANYNDYYQKNAKKNMDDYTNPEYSTKNTISLILEDYQKNKAIFEKYIGDKKFPIFDEIMRSMESNIKWNEFNSKDVPQSYIFREQYMYTEFMKLLNKNPDAKFYAQFGRCHTSVVNQPEACGWYNYNSIATRINESDNNVIRGKVMSMAILYPKSYNSNSKDSVDAINIISKVGEDGIYLVKINSDKSFDEIRDKYKYVIVNQFLPDSSPRDTTALADSAAIIHSKSNPRIFFHFNYLKGNHYIEMSDFNNFLTSFKLPQIAQPILTNGVGITSVNKYNGVSVSIDYKWIEPLSMSKGDTSTSFAGHFFNFNIGRDLIKSKFAHIIPSIGLTFANVKYTIKSNSANTILGDNVISEYQNPACIISFNTEVRLNIKFISIGFRTGYGMDFSNQHWRNQDAIIKSSPKTSLGGPNILGVISFTIKGN